MENKSKASYNADDIQKLIDQIQSSDEDVQYHATTSLRDIIDDKKFPDSKIPALIPLIQHTNVQVADYGIWLSGRTTNKELLQPLLQSLQRKEAELRAEAAEALDSFNEKEVIQALVKLLDDADDKVRSTAAYSLGHLRAVEAFDDLVRLLQDKNVEVREAAILALKDIGKPEILPHLQWLAENDFAYIPYGGLTIAGLAKRAIKEINQK